MTYPADGLRVLCSNGQHVPDPQLLSRYAMPGATVGDMLGWHRCETYPGHFELGQYATDLYTAVAQAGLSNYVTIGGGNRLYTPNSGADTFPIWRDAAGVVHDVSDRFAAFAAWVARTVPNLAALEIWNEYTGDGAGVDVHGHPVALADRKVWYPIVAGKVMAAVWAVAPHTKLVLGSTVGFNIQGWMIAMRKAGALPADPRVFMGVHPYFGPPKVFAPPGVVPEWTKQITHIRDAGIENQIWHGEHGGPIASKLGADYWHLFDGIREADPVDCAGSNYFLEQQYAHFLSGLVDGTDVETALGRSRREWMGPRGTAEQVDARA